MSASLTNKPKNAAVLANQAKQGRRLGSFTIAEVSDSPVSRFADKTFDTIVTIVTNQTKH